MYSIDIYRKCVHSIQYILILNLIVIACMYEFQYQTKINSLHWKKSYNARKFSERLFFKRLLTPPSQQKLFYKWLEWRYAFRKVNSTFYSLHVITLYRNMVVVKDFKSRHDNLQPRLIWVQSFLLWVYMYIGQSTKVYYNVYFVHPNLFNDQWQLQKNSS